MRIAEILLRPAVGGAETLAAGLERHWSGQGHAVATFFVDPAGASQRRRDRLRRLRRALRRFAPDVIHAHSALPNLYARLAALGQVPIVTVLHSTERSFDRRELRWAEHVLGPWTGHVVAVSPHQADEYRERFGTSTPLTLIPNGVRDDLHRRAHPSPRLAVATSLCRLAPTKRIDVLTAGWAEAGLTDAELLIAGSSPDDATGRRVAGWIENCPGARALGDVADVSGLLSRTDLLVHAADAEAHPLAPLEAAVAGVPVVLSDRVSARVPEVPALTFRAGDASDLASTLRRASADYTTLAREALDQALVLRARFSLASCGDAHLSVLEDTIASHRRGRPRG